MIAFTLIIVACGLFAVYVQPYREEWRRWQRFDANWGLQPGVFERSVRGVFAGDEYVPQLLRDTAGPGWFGVIRTVYLDDGPWDAKTVADLTAFRHLEELDFQAPDISDEVLSQLHQLPRLRILKLGSADISARRLTFLRDCRSLRFLHLNETNCRLEHLQALADLPLELVFTNFPLTGENLRSPLTRIVAPRSPWTLSDFHEGRLAALAELNYWKYESQPSIELHLRDSQLSPADVDALCALPFKFVDLKRVRLAPAQQLRLMQGAGRSWKMRADRETISLKALADTFGRTAREAKVGSARILLPDLELRWDEPLTDEEWADFYVRVPQLESLEVDITLSANLLEHWAALPRLKTLQFYVDSYREPEVQRLRTAPALESLQIYHGALHREHWEFLREMPQLRDLFLWNFHREDIDPETLKTIVAAPGLTQLTLAYWQPRDEHLAALTSAKQLRILELRGLGEVTAEGQARLKAALPQLEVRVR